MACDPMHGNGGCVRGRIDSSANKPGEIRVEISAPKQLENSKGKVAICEDVNRGIGRGIGMEDMIDGSTDRNQLAQVVGTPT